MSAGAPIVGVHYRTVQAWISGYRAGGLVEVLKHKCGGHAGLKSRLTKAQETELVTKSKAVEIHSIWDGVEWAKNERQVSYPYWGMRSVFQRLELTKKFPRPKSPKISAADQKTWKKRGLIQLPEKGGGQITGLGWGNEMRVGLIGQTRRVWAPRGDKVEMEVEDIFAWAYLNLIVNGLTGSIAWGWIPSMKSSSIAPVLKK